MSTEATKLDRILAVIEFAASPGSAFSSKGATDPVRLVADALRQRMQAESDVFTDEDDGVEAIDSDSRPAYSDLLRRLLTTFVKHAAETHQNPEDWTSLSTTASGNVMKVLELLVGMSILPGLDDGIGIPLEKRVSFVKIWKRFESEQVAASELRKTLVVFNELCEVNEVLKVQAMSKFLPDFISANEQLIHLGNTSLSQSYEATLSVLPPSVLMRELLLLNGGFGLSGKKAMAPTWFLQRIDKRLSTMLSSGKNGLFHLFVAFNDLGGESFWQNSVILTAVATLLATKPKDAPSYQKYAIGIFGQFLEVMKSHKFSADVSLLFGLTVDRLHARAPFIIEVQLVDKLVRPWELLLERGLLNYQDAVHGLWNLGLDGSVVILRAWLNARKTGATMEDFAFDARFAKLVPFFWHLAGQAATVNGLEDFVEAMSIVLARLIGEKKAKEAGFVLGQMLDDGNGTFGYFGVKKANVPLVSEIPESAANAFKFPVFVEILEEPAEEESLLDWKLLGFKQILKHFPPSITLKVLTTLMADAVAIWTGSTSSSYVPDPADVSARFVPQLESTVAQSGKRLAAVYVLGAVVDLLGTIWTAEGDSSGAECTPEALADMLDISKTLFCASTSTIRTYADVDTLAVTPESAELSSVEAKTLSLAVGLVGGVIAFAIDEPELRKRLVEVSAEMRAFLTAFGTVKDADIVERYNSTAESMKQLLKLFEEDLKLVEDTSNSDATSATASRKPRGFKRTQTKLEEWQELLDDEEEAARGYALIDIAKFVRSRDRSVFKTDVIIDTVWNAAMAQAAHSDSYVFLASINVLAEIAYWRTDPFLGRLVEAFLSWSTGGGAGSDEKLALAGKMGEAVAKVFRQLGDFSPIYFDEFANGLLFMTKAGDELARASALSALADLIAGDRGRRMKSMIHELLDMVSAYLKTEDSALVRRATIHLLRSMLSAPGDDLLNSFSSTLTEIHRLLKRLWLQDRDEVVRFHAELTLIDLNATMQRLLTL
uniref:RTP1_C1 domain-containing protein n=1 Tax=Panagrellus redivivus TaxID=6233 RepID=A0A7E4VY04_PANRE